MNCYICGKSIAPATTGVVVQPHEGTRHPTCDPQVLPVEHPGTVFPGDIPDAGLTDEEVEQSLGELRRHMRVVARARSEQSKSTAKAD